MWEWERYFQYGSPRKMLTHTQSGLIHTSKMGRSGGKLEVGQRVEVKVLNIDIAKGRIGLELVKLL